MHVQLGTQQLRRDATFQGLVETLELALVLIGYQITTTVWRIRPIASSSAATQRCNSSACSNGGSISSTARFSGAGRNARGSSQPSPWCTATRRSPAMFLEQAAVLGMQFVEQHAVLGAGQAPRQFRRARVIAQGAVRVQVTDHVQVIVQLLGQAFALPQAGDALLPLAGAAGLVTLQVVEADPGMAVQVGVRRVLAPSRAKIRASTRCLKTSAWLPAW